MKRVFCGGKFCFDYKEADYRTKAGEDYRAALLGDIDLLLSRREHVGIGDGVEYIGPFYFETDGMQDREIIQAETDMIRRCSDAFFLLDDGLCPGTVAELTLASCLQKNVHIYFIRRGDAEETESDLHTPCWYAILQSELLNENVSVCACTDRQEAKSKLIRAVHDLSK